MAKKTASKRTAPVAKAPAAISAKVIDQAAPIASVVRLRGILAEQFHAIRTIDAFTDSDNTKAWLKSEGEDICRDTEGNSFSVRIRFSLRVTKDGAETDADPSVEIMCVFVLVYEVPSFEGMSDEALKTFAQTSGVFSAWPYWREFVHSTTFRLSVPPIVLPTYRISS